MSIKHRSAYIVALALTGVGLVATSFVPKAHADEWDKRTVVTVKQPIIVGDKVFEPGKYVWRLMRSPMDRHIVEIYDGDGQHLQEMVLATPNYRVVPTDHSQFAFWETPAGVPKAVRAWFYPGDNFGQEFTYPKKLVAQLASAAPVPVPSNYREPEPQPAPEAQPAPAPEPQPEAAPAPVPTPAPQPQTQAAPDTNTTPAQQQSLPHTGSTNPLIGLLGLISLSLAGLLSLAYRRS
jgi:LPXTG-motif cell wall-anchored protein